MKTTDIIPMQCIAGDVICNVKKSAQSGMQLLESWRPTKFKHSTHNRYDNKVGNNTCTHANILFTQLLPKCTNCCMQHTHMHNVFTQHNVHHKHQVHTAVLELETKALSHVGQCITSRILSCAYAAIREWS